MELIDAGRKGGWNTGRARAYAGKRRRAGGCGGGKRSEGRRETERGKPYNVTALVFPTRVDESFPPFPSIAVVLALLLVNR